MPASDGADALADATAACRSVSTISTEIAVSGSVGGQRLRGRIVAGLAPPSSARLEAVAPFGQPLFIFVARGDDATLLLPRENRVLEHGASDAVLEAVTGVPLDAAALRLALTGCTSLAADAAHATDVGTNWRLVPDGQTDVYLRRDGKTGRWRVAATVYRASPSAAGRTGGTPWRAEYGDVQSMGLPRSIRFISTERDRFDLRLTLSQVDVNMPLAADVFRVQVPRDAEPITVDELRRARPGVREN